MEFNWIDILILLSKTFVFKITLLHNFNSKRDNRLVIIYFRSSVTIIYWEILLNRVDLKLDLVPRMT